LFWLSDSSLGGLLESNKLDGITNLFGWHFWGWVTTLDGSSESIGRMDGLDVWHLLGLSGIIGWMAFVGAE
jgi:hypothetical protein